MRELRKFENGDRVVCDSNVGNSRNKTLVSIPHLLEGPQQGPLPNPRDISSHTQTLAIRCSTTHPRTANSMCCYHWDYPRYGWHLHWCKSAVDTSSVEKARFRNPVIGYNPILLHLLLCSCKRTGSPCCCNGKWEGILEQLHDQMRIPIRIQKWNEFGDSSSCLTKPIQYLSSSEENTDLPFTQMSPFFHSLSFLYCK